LTHCFIAVNLEQGVNRLYSAQFFMHFNAADQIANALVELSKQLGQLLPRNFTDFSLKKGGKGLCAFRAHEFIPAFDVVESAVCNVGQSQGCGHTHHLNILKRAQARTHPAYLQQKAAAEILDLRGTFHDKSLIFQSGICPAFTRSVLPPPPQQTRSAHQQQPHHSARSNFSERGSLQQTLN
jgi:hypothetical protein